MRKYLQILSRPRQISLAVASLALVLISAHLAREALNEWAVYLTTWAFYQLGLFVATVLLAFARKRTAPPPAREVRIVRLALAMPGFISFLFGHVLVQWGIF